MTDTYQLAKCVLISSLNTAMNQDTDLALSVPSGDAVGTNQNGEALISTYAGTSAPLIGLAIMTALTLPLFIAGTVRSIPTSTTPENS